MDKDRDLDLQGCAIITATEKKTLNTEGKKLIRLFYIAIYNKRLMHSMSKQSLSLSVNAE